MRLRTLGAIFGSVGGIGAGALTQSQEYSYLALPVAVASGLVLVIVTIWFLWSHRRRIWGEFRRLGPLYVILFGLIVALGGAAWLAL
jgi:predicted RND superfamily exporter protein